MRWSPASNGIHDDSWCINGAGEVQNFSNQPRANWAFLADVVIERYFMVAGAIMVAP